MKYINKTPIHLIYSNFEYNSFVGWFAYELVSIGE